MKKILIFVLLLISFNCKSQSVTPLVVTNMPGIINESSGLEKTGPNFFWSHNDSGGQPEIYGFDSSGTLLKTIDVTNASNIDWEEIAQGDNGEFYIGDFGNNSNNRSVANGNPLRIYIISDPDLLGTTTTAGILQFEYEDRNFSASGSNHNFDMEGFFYFNDSLHLFTKNRTSPSNGWIKHYKLPAFAGTHQAILVDSFNNGGTRITAADISPDKKTVILIGNNIVHLFSCFTGSKFLSTSFVKTFSMPNTQKEAVVFGNNKLAYLTDEGGNLYRLGLYNHIDDTLNISSMNDTICFGMNNGILTASVIGGSLPYNYLWSNGTTTSVNTNLLAGNYNLSLTDNHGCNVNSSFLVYETDEILFTSQIDSTCFNSSTGNILITETGTTTPYSYLWSNGETTNLIDSLPAGNYILELTDTNGCMVSSNYDINEFEEITFSSIIDSTCPNQNAGAIFVSVLSGESPFTYLWSTNETSSSISNLNENNYDLTISDNHGCSIDTQFMVNEFNLIQPNLNFVYDMIYSDQNNLNNWYLNGNILIGENTDSLQYSQNGYYQVSYIDNNGCEVLSDSLHITTTSINDDLAKNEIIIYKNENGYVLQNNSNLNSIIEIYSLNGKLISNINLNTNESRQIQLNQYNIHLFRFFTSEGEFHSILK
jgi:hypothetical protein